MPKQLRERCEKLANNQNLPLSEWINRVLIDITSESKGIFEKSLIEDIDDFVTSDNLFGVSNRVEFMREALRLMKYAESCPECGENNPAGATYCAFCGAELNYRDSDYKYAYKYLDNYEKEHPLPKGWTYCILSPTKNFENRFGILKYPTNERPNMSKVVAYIPDEDIEEMKESERMSTDSKIFIDKISSRAEKANADKTQSKKINPE